MLSCLSGLLTYNIKTRTKIRINYSATSLYEALAQKAINMTHKWKRIDENQTDIVETIRRFGPSVVSIASIGKGCPDLLVGFQQRNYLFEIKNPDKPKCDQQLTELEEQFHSTWRGQIAVIHTWQEALEIMGVLNQLVKQP
jgi:hypothetical protein